MSAGLPRHDVALSLGSNLGRREENVLRAIALLDRLDGFELRAVSSLYETEPLGIVTERPFINAACTARTSLTPRSLLAACAAIERDLGRLPSIRPSDRTIDIDLLLHGDGLVEEHGLIVPHPRMRARLFVLIPLGEVAPDFLVAPDGRSVRELRDGCGVEGWVTKVSSRRWVV